MIHIGSDLKLYHCLIVTTLLVSYINSDPYIMSVIDFDGLGCATCSVKSSHHSTGHSDRLPELHR